MHQLTKVVVRTAGFAWLLCGCSDSGRDGSIFESTAGIGDSSNADSGDSGDSGDGDEDGPTTSDESGPGTSFDLANGDGDEGPPDCAETTVMATSVPSNVVLVLDYSSSMKSSIGGLFGDTRWAVLWDAVEYATSNYDANINFGAVLFPDMAVVESNSCTTEDVEVPVAPLNGATVMATIPPRDHSPPGNTPTRAGLGIAAAHLGSLDPQVPQALILVTDGEALCGEGQWAELTDETVPAYVGELAAAGIPTYVIGMASLNSTAQAQLDAMAQASGVPNPNGPKLYYSASDLAQLQTAFDAVAGDVITCEIELEFPPTDPEYLVVEIAGTPVPYVEVCEGNDGWTFVPDTNNTWIELCGAACVDFQHDGSVHVVQACPPQG